MLDAAQLGVQLGQFEQRTLLDYFSFHVPFLSIFHGSVRMADTRTGNESPNAPRSSSAAWVHQGYSLAQCATSTSATSDALRCSSAGWCRRSAVMYACTPAAATTSSSESPAPPHTATLDTGASESPDARTPHDVPGNASCTRDTK